MRALGLALDGEQLALSAASHWGEPKHVDAVRAVLASAGLDESALQTTPALPEDADARRAVVRGDGVARPIYHGCSGKHAAMLATCVLRGWDVTTYLDVDHPLQAALREYVEGVVGATDRAHRGRWVRCAGMGDAAARPGARPTGPASWPSPGRRCGTSRTRCGRTPSTCAVSSQRSPG